MGTETSKYAGHTPGPWRWTTMGSNNMMLATPNRGRLIIMDFCRKGMNGAMPRFARRDPADRGGILEDVRTPEEAESFPDARLISDAPLLLAQRDAAVSENERLKSACEAAADWIGKLKRWQNESGITAHEVLDKLRASLSPASTPASPEPAKAAGGGA